MHGLRFLPEMFRVTCANASNAFQLITAILRSRLKIASEKKVKKFQLWRGIKGLLRTIKAIQ